MTPENGILALDTETNGVDVYNDRIITAFVGRMTPSGYFEQQKDWLLNPGVEIPQGAIDVHGITNEHVREHGRTDVGAALHELWVIIHQECIAGGRPLVAYNAPFDLTLLVEESKRHGVPMPDLSLLNVIDPLVIDKGLNKYRKGSRKLVDVAPHYGVPVEMNAHDAGADCLMAGRIALKQLAKTRDSLEQLHTRQVEWKLEQSASLQHYFRTKGNKPDAVVEGGWPVYAPRPVTFTEETAA